MDRQITDLFFDRDQNLWVGTQNSGLYKIAFQPVRFQFFRFDYEKQSGLAHRDISFPLATRSGNVWISTWGGGINVWDKDDLDRDEPVFKKIPLVLDNGKPLTEKRIFPLFEDNDENIWFGTLGGGLYFLDNADRRRHQYNYQVFNKANISLPSDSVSALCLGKNGTVWCGTYGGLVRINAGHKIEKSFSELENPEIFSRLPISMLVKENRDVLWVGTRTGTVFRWNLTTHKLQRFNNSKTTNIGILMNGVKTNKLIWFASTTGLFYYDNIAFAFRPFVNNNLLPAKSVQSLLTDSEGKLWAGTMHGLAKIDPFNNEVKTFNLPGGIMGTSFTQGASKDKSGYLYFGSRYGFYRFLPENIEFQPPSEKVVINTISVGGQIYRTDTLWKTKLWKPNSAEKGGFLNLNYRQNTLSFEYRSLNFAPDEVVKYHVLLEGFDSEWTSTTDTRRTWSALLPGSYTLKIKSKLSGSSTDFHFVIQQA